MSKRVYSSDDLHLAPLENELDKLGCDKDGNYISGRVYGKVYLDHSCDEWVIGGKKEVEQLIADLQKILEQLGR